MCWQDVRYMHHLMCAPLWWHHYATDLFHLRIVRWTHAVQVAGNLTISNHIQHSTLYTCNKEQNDRWIMVYFTSIISEILLSAECNLI